VPPGRYPVILSIATFRENGDQRVACAKVRLSEQKSVRWAMATRPGQDLSTLENGHFFGYGVDAGTGCFMDVVAAQAFSNRKQEDANYGEVIVDELLKTFVNTWSWIDLPLDPATGANLIAFSSGFGDGRYASYFGYDRDGQPACLVTDFAIFDFSTAGTLNRPARTIKQTIVRRA
jgi:hypothetical protein